MQSHRWLTASSYMTKYSRLSLNIRKPFFIHDFAPDSIQGKVPPFSYLCISSVRHKVHTECMHGYGQFMANSSVHWIMMEKLAQPGEGGGCMPTLFHYIYHIYTPTISTLPLFVLCGVHLPMTALTKDRCRKVEGGGGGLEYLPTHPSLTAPPTPPT